MSRVAKPAEPLTGATVDNHCHLDMARGGEPEPDVGLLLRQAAEVGVDRVVHIGCDLERAERALKLAEQHPSLLAAVALHPNEAPRLAEAGQLGPALARIEELAAHPRVRAISETGLDYYRTGPEGREAQHASFRVHIGMAKRLGKPMQIHDREAHDDVLRILEEEGAPEQTVFHCFSGEPTMARECVERGYYLSFAGTVTYKNAFALREALTVVPLDRVLVETDAPYLAPTPNRGTTNAPAQIPFTLRTMAEVLGVSVEELAQATSDNAERLYGPWNGNGS